MLSFPPPKSLLPREALNNTSTYWSSTPAPALSPVNKNSRSTRRSLYLLLLFCFWEEIFLVLATGTDEGSTSTPAHSEEDALDVNTAAVAAAVLGNSTNRKPPPRRPRSHEVGDPSTFFAAPWHGRIRAYMAKLEEEMKRHNAGGRGGGGGPPAAPDPAPARSSTEEPNPLTTGEAPGSASTGSTPTPPSVPVKILWTYWAQDLEKAPRIARACVKKMRRLHPPESGWEVRVLSRANLTQYLDEDEAILIRGAESTFLEDPPGESGGGTTPGAAVGEPVGPPASLLSSSGEQNKQAVGADMDKGTSTPPPPPSLRDAYLAGWRRQGSPINHQFASDYLRLFLLYKYGGVWMDITSVLSESLDWVYDEKLANNGEELSSRGAAASSSSKAQGEGGRGGSPRPLLSRAPKNGVKDEKFESFLFHLNHRFQLPGFAFGDTSHAPVVESWFIAAKRPKARFVTAWLHRFLEIQLKDRPDGYIKDFDRKGLDRPWMEEWLLTYLRIHNSAFYILQKKFNEICGPGGGGMARGEISSGHHYEDLELRRTHPAPPVARLSREELNVYGGAHGGAIVHHDARSNEEKDKIRSAEAEGAQAGRGTNSSDRREDFVTNTTPAVLSSKVVEVTRRRLEEVDEDSSTPSTTAQGFDGYPPSHPAAVPITCFPDWDGTASAALEHYRLRTETALKGPYNLQYWFGFDWHRGDADIRLAQGGSSAERKFAEKIMQRPWKDASGTKLPLPQYFMKLVGGIVRSAKVPLQKLPSGKGKGASVSSSASLLPP